MADNNTLNSQHTMTTSIYSFLSNLLAVVRTSESIRSEARENDTLLSNLKPGGYPEDIFIFLSEREKAEYICSICYSMINDAHQCSNGHTFCYSCIYVWSTCNRPGADFCPTCRCDGMYARNEQLNGKMGAKRVKCQDVICNWRGYLRDFDDHEHRHYEYKELSSPVQWASLKMNLPHPESTETDGDTLRSETSIPESTRASSLPNYIMVSLDDVIKSYDSQRLEYRRLAPTYASRHALSSNGEDHLVLMLILLTSDHDESTSISLSVPSSSESTSTVSESSSTPDPRRAIVNNDPDGAQPQNLDEHLSEMDNRWNVLLESAVVPDGTWESSVGLGVAESSPWDSDSGTEE